MTTNREKLNKQPKSFESPILKNYPRIHAFISRIKEITKILQITKNQKNTQTFKKSKNIKLRKIDVMFMNYENV